MCPFYSEMAKGPQLRYLEGSLHFWVKYHYYLVCCYKESKFIMSSAYNEMVDGSSP